MSAQLISGLLIDIDGVLITGNHPIPGATETLNYLKQQKIPFLLITNTTRKSRVNVWHQLKRFGLSVEQEQILTAPLAAVNWLKQRHVTAIHLFLSGSAAHDFRDFKITAGQPEYVVVGDVGSDLSFEKLNQAFRLLMRGARLLALQKNRYWQTSEGLTIDAGALVAALEYASHKRAIVIGKPRKEFFLEGVKLLNLPPENVAIIGDDLEADILGGKKAGLQTIAVKTGKFRNYLLEKLKIQPDYLLESVADLPGLLKP